MTIFIKPHNTQFCIAVFETVANVVKLSRVAFVTGENEVVEFLLQYKNIETVRFDGTEYMQTGISIRKKTDLPNKEIQIFIYKGKGNVHDRIAVQQEWLMENVSLNENNNDTYYARFENMLSDYDPTNKNCDTMAADLMADAARYFRRLM